MSALDDRAVARLRSAAAMPDLGERYEVSGPIGYGGSSAVFAARDKLLARDVAVKVADGFASDDASDRRLSREAQILASLEHPGIVPVHDSGVTADGRAFYVMTLVRGTRLGEAAVARSLTERLGLFLKVCDSVAFAHAHGVVHRDLKPDNVMVGPFGEVFVLDWGVAQVGGTSAEPMIVGTPGFMPPEQAAGEPDVDRRADVFALGALLEVLMGPAAPRPLEAVARRALAEQPADRYASAEDLHGDVRRYLEGLAVTAYEEPVIERLSRLYTRYRVPIVLVAAYMAMRVVLLLWKRQWYTVAPSTVNG